MLSDAGSCTAVRLASDGGPRIIASPGQALPVWVTSCRLRRSTARTPPVRNATDSIARVALAVGTGSAKSHKLDYRDRA